MKKKKKRCKFVFCLIKLKLIIS